jgi:hypothetical protein
MTKIPDDIRDLARSLNLGDWQIEIDPDPADPECAAHIYRWPEKIGATISIAGDGNDQGPLWERSPEEIRLSILHELLHLHHIIATDLIEKEIDRVYGDGAYGRRILEPIHEAIEIGTDALARAICAAFPLPPSPSEGSERNVHQGGRKAGSRTKGRKSCN